MKRGLGEESSLAVDGIVVVVVAAAAAVAADRTGGAAPDECDIVAVATTPPLAPPFDLPPTNPSPEEKEQILLVG